MAIGGKMKDGTPFVIIDGGTPEAEEYIVHCKCEKCGKEHHFNLWDMVALKPITCEHCGNVTVATRGESC